MIGTLLTLLIVGFLFYFIYINLTSPVHTNCNPVRNNQQFEYSPPPQIHPVIEPQKCPPCQIKCPKLEDSDPRCPSDRYILKSKIKPCSPAKRNTKFIIHKFIPKPVYKTPIKKDLEKSKSNSNSKNSVKNTKKKSKTSNCPKVDKINDYENGDLKWIPVENTLCRLG